MIIMGAGTNHWFHSDTIYRAFLALTTLTGCQGVNGGGWAHYVGQEKCRPVTGWAQLAFGAGLVPPAAADDRHRVLVPAHRPVALRPLRRRRARLAARRAARSPGKTTADLLAQSARLGWMPSLPDVRPQPARPGRRGRGRRAAPVAEHVVDELQGRAAAVRLRGPGRAGELPAGADRVAGQPARLLGQGQRVLPAAPARHRRVGARRPRRRRSSRPQDVVWRDEAPEGKLDLLLSLDFRMTSHHALLRRRAAGRHLVREARPVHHRHAPVRARLQPGDRPAVADPHRLRRLPRHRRGVQPAGRRRTSASARTWSPRRCCTTPPTSWPPRTGVVRDWKAGECEPVPGPDDAQARRRSSATTARSPTKMAALGPLLDTARRHDQGRHRSTSTARSSTCGSKNGTVRGGVADGRPSLARDIARVRGDPGAVRHHQRAPGHRRASETLEERTGHAAGRPGRRARGQADHLRRHPGPAGAGHHLARSGRARETGGRRYSPFTINVERLKPWHTLTGRQHFFLDHDWMAELGEQLPVFRPPLDMHALFGEPRDRRARASSGITVRYLTPHSKWSIHSEYQDNLFMLSLSRGGPTIWMSDAGRGEDRRRATTTGSRRSTATASSSPARSSRTGCPRAPSTCTTPRTGSIDVPQRRDHRPARRHPQLADPAADQAQPPHRRLRPAVASPSTTSARPATSATRSP